MEEIQYLRRKSHFDLKVVYTALKVWFCVMLYFRLIFSEVK